ncbi:immunity 52 family protein [Myxococcus sp. CA033]|uniref:immunity 52 family protein n=1 Tax=Myxococcus sp. CA033 TaxID=2741516 RepID=UPI00352D5650
MKFDGYKEITAIHTLARPLVPSEERIMTVQSAPRAHPETYYAGAHWGPRRESPEECARRAATFLNMLAACDPLLAHWNKLPKPRKGRKIPLMPPDLPTLTEAFRRGVNRDSGGPPIEELGWTVSAYNDGAGSNFVSVRMQCGGYVGCSTDNACLLSLPYPGKNAERILAASVLTEVVRAMAVAWEPDWAVVMSRAHRDMDDEEGKADIWVGWVTYLARHWGTVPPLPAPVRVEPVEDKGTLIVLTPERFTVANPEHVALSRRVRELLARAGLVKPLQPPP